MMKWKTTTVINKNQQTNKAYMKNIIKQMVNILKQENNLSLSLYIYIYVYVYNIDEK